ncbi:MAG: hypothetical protein LBL92_07225 [Propionibacteriaceae bacterium]|jgi:hypothetical protein|nr:hypothetical protein [Propionibacteriaceae bacterium]
MINYSELFPPRFDAETVDFPGDGVFDYMFSDGVGGDFSCAVKVYPFGGSSWLGKFVAGKPLLNAVVSGLFATPNSCQLCAVVKGTPFLVDVESPRGSEVLVAGGVLTNVFAAQEVGLLLLATPWNISALSAEGKVWVSPRLAMEAISIRQIERDRLWGTADPDDEARDFVIDLTSGQQVS